MYRLQQHQPTAALRRVYFTLVDATDGFTAEPGLTFSGAEIQVSKVGAAFANATNVAAATQQSDGSYYVELAAAELDTLGSLRVKIEKTGCRLAWVDAWVDAVTPQLAVAAAVAADGSNSTTTFKTDLASSVNDFYNGDYILFVSSSALNGQVRKVVDYVGSTKFVTVSPPTTVAPTSGDKFVLINH